MKAFHLELSVAQLDQICADAERHYPNEACGLGFGRTDAAEVVELVAMENVQDKYHALDPVQFPRTARDAFRLDEGRRLKLLRQYESQGLSERLLYHSHPDAGAYFSPEDRASAVFEGMELMPGVVHVVVSVKAGVRADIAAFRYNEGQASFEEVRLGEGWRTEPSSPFGGSDWPDLSRRAMEGREAARPIAPVGGTLVLRRITAQEKAELSSRAEGRRVQIDEAAHHALVAFGTGAYSPLSGFMTQAEVDAAKAGTLVVGTVEWQRPVTLEVDAVPSGLAEADVVELWSSAGVPAGLLAVSEIRPGARIGLAGDVYVYPEGLPPDAAEVRAQWLRTGARRILAARDPEAVEGFDAVMDLPRVNAEQDDWLRAVIAQNLGATHVLVDASMISKGQAGLAITGVEAPGPS